MATFFLSKAPIQLDNIIVYQGPPAPRKKSPPTATRAGVKSAQQCQARWSFPAVENEPTSSSGEYVAANINPSPTDHDEHRSSHSHVMDIARTSRSDDQLPSLESFDLFDLNSIMHGSRFPSEIDPLDIGVTANLNGGRMTDLQAFDTAATTLAQHELSGCEHFETMQTCAEPQPQPPTDTASIDLGSKYPSTEARNIRGCPEPIGGGFTSDECGTHVSDDTTPIAREGVDGRAAFSELVALDLFKPPPALREVLHTTAAQAAPDLSALQGEVIDNTLTCRAIDLRDPCGPSVEGHDPRRQYISQRRSASDESVPRMASPGRPTDHGSGDDDTPFVPGRRRRNQFSALIPPDSERDDDAPRSSRVDSITTENLQHVRRGRKRSRAETVDADDDDSSGTKANYPRLRNTSSQDSTAERREKRRNGSSDSHQDSGHLAAISSQVPDAVMHSPTRWRNPRRVRNCATAKRQPETRVASILPEKEEQPTWAVDRIVKSAKRNGDIFYKVKWKDTWEPAASLHGCADTAVAEFHAKRSGSAVLHR